jgi:glycosyltransferase involved in cell wall biosynthesis
MLSLHQPFDIRLFEKEASSLAAHGWEVTIVAPHQRNEVVGNIKIEAMPVPRSRWGRLVLMPWRLLFRALQTSADLYHVHDPASMPIGLLLTLLGRKVVYDSREHAPRDMLDKYYLPGWCRTLMSRSVALVEQVACPRFAAVVPASPVVAEHIRHLNHNVVTICNFPILRKLVTADDVAWSERTNAVTYVGIIGRNRGLIEMIRAIDMVPEALNARLKLGGNFSSPELAGEIKLVPGHERVDVLGFLERPAMAQLLTQVRVGLAVLHPTPQYQSSYATKMFEYMAASVPVVCSDFPLWREIIDDAGCGLLADPLDPGDIARAIEYLLSHPAEAEAMGRRGRRAVEERYNWTHEETKLLNLYATLAAGGAAQGAELRHVENTGTS